MPSGELDYDNVRTAEEFVEAVGGADYAVASDSSSWVLLKQDVYLPQDITMTGNFSINLQGHKICSASHEAGPSDLISAKGNSRSSSTHSRKAVWRQIFS